MLRGFRLPAGLKGLENMADNLSADTLQLQIGNLEEKIARLERERELGLQMLGMVSDGLMIVDRGGKIAYINAGMEKITGYAKDEMIGGDYADPRWKIRCVSEQGVEDDPVFGWILQAGRPLAEKACVMDLDDGRKKSFSIDAAPLVDPSGSIIAIAALIRDVTEQSRLSEEHQEMKDVYRRLTQYADEAILRVWPDGRISYQNEAAEKILGFSLEDYLSDSSLALRVFHKNFVRDWMRVVGDVSSGKDVLKNIVAECTARDGRTVIMEFTAIAVRDPDGRLLYFELLGRDVTVRRYMEAELAKAQKLESIGLLAGGIAHDFNNILTSVFGSLALAKMDVSPGSSVYERLTAAEEHCVRAKNLTRKLLAYSRGGSPLRRTASIASVLREAVGFTLSGKNIRCAYDLPDDLWAAQIDEGQMHQVVHSLVTNAVEAMPQGGVIEVGAANVSLRDREIPPLAAGNYIRWYVRDHGVGISPDHLKKLFDPYFTTKQMGSIKGMGLGLAICYTIVKSHEGMIFVESTPGEGTTFTVYVPASNGDKQEDKPAPERVAGTAGGHRVLLVDDEQILLDVTGSMLKHLGYDVATATSHEDALNLYGGAMRAGRPFSLIIMDLTMRGDEGGETAIRRWLAAYPGVKALISSGYMNDPVIEEYWKYGFVGAMVKPYSLHELKNTLEKILAGKNN